MEHRAVTQTHNTQKNRNTETQKHRNTETQKPRKTESQKDIQTESQKDEKMKEDEQDSFQMTSNELLRLNFAKIALHKLPGKSNLNARSVCPVSPF